MTTALRHAIAQASQGELFNHRAEISRALSEAVAATAEPWGLQVISVDVCDVHPRMRYEPVPPSGTVVVVPQHPA